MRDDILKRIRIQKCGKKDIDEAGRLYDHVVSYLTAHVNYPRWIPGVYPSVDTVREMTGRDVQYGIFLDGRMIGAFGLDTEPQGKYEKGSWSRDLSRGSYMVLHALAVIPEMQGCGIGEAVVRFCIAKAKKDGYKAIRLDIIPDNYPAKALYEKCGFRYAGDVDLELEIADIPLFSLYELNW